MWYELYIFRCDRCFALFALRSMEETRGDVNAAELLGANDCAACGKGAVEFVGTLKLAR